MAKKSHALKRWLIKRNRRNRRMPVFVLIRTGGRIGQNKFRRRWRTDKLGTRNMRVVLGKKDKVRA